MSGKTVDVATKRGLADGRARQAAIVACRLGRDDVSHVLWSTCSHGQVLSGFGFNSRVVDDHFVQKCFRLEAMLEKRSGVRAISNLVRRNHCPVAVARWE